MNAHLCCVEHLQGGDVWAGGQPGGRQTTENQQSTQHGERHNDYIRGRSEAWVGAALLYTAQILAEIRKSYVTLADWAGKALENITYTGLTNWPVVT